jgi:predicted RNase H-like HicB family nuclease
MAPFAYRVVVAYSPEDQAYVARVPALEGVAAHGVTAEEATREAQVAARALLATLERHQRPIPPPDA